MNEWLGFVFLTGGVLLYCAAFMAAMTWGVNRREKKWRRGHEQ